MPVRDKQHWEKMNSVEVHPPIYEKKIGRPKKSRKKAPMELEGSTKLSKHGATMHCSICKSADHNKRNHSRCVEQNQGVQLPNVQANDAEVDPTILEDINPKRANPNMDPSQTNGSMIFNLLHEDPLKENRNRQLPGPLPESVFVEQHRADLPPPSTT
ncbi:hypothetical protein PVAP13_2NG479703 [Panicum virgatum]|uniref:Uncharacterized protein n=1 Tax=Panicum virgatum TaxID=38727 RepID=A0A8T0VVC9_PANVG|nr:hypothetical protein PVAP13_2NG479703 [Panicum virgatum]